VGFETPGGSGEPWCWGGGGAQSCVNPLLPSGTDSQHTQVLGENFALAPPLPHPEGAGSSAPAIHISPAQGTTISLDKLTQIDGGHGAYAVFNLQGAQYLDVVGFNISSFFFCQEQGSPKLKDCVKGSPIDDYGSAAIDTNPQTANFNFQDLWIHGTTSAAIEGAVGDGYAAYDDLLISITPQSGINFDHNGAITQGAKIFLTNSIIEWSGCDQQIPAPYPFPSTPAQTAANLVDYGCFDQGSGGVTADSIGTGSGQGYDVFVHNNTFRYNTQDGNDFGHADTGIGHVYDFAGNSSYSNMGQAYKWGWAFGTINFVNNLAIADGWRMKYPIAGAPAHYNANLSYFDRSGDTLSFNFQAGTKALFAHNTIIGYQTNVTDYKCVPVAGQLNCDDVVVTIRDNIFRAYANAANEAYGGNSSPAMWCGAQCNGGFDASNGNNGGRIGRIDRDHNIYFGLRSNPANSLSPDTIAGTVTNEQYIDAGFINQPLTDAGTFNQSQLDNFNFNLASTSPAKGAGVTMAALPTDYNSFAYASPPSMGALEFGSTPSTPPPAATLSSMTISATPSSGTATFTSTFSSRCTYSDGSTGACPTVTYSSTSAGVTISGATGTFSQAGTALVTGHLAGVADATTSVGVSAAPPPPAATLTSVSAALSTYIVPVGGTSAITCTANYSDGSHPTFTGTANSQTPALATVSGFTARAVAAGSATLQCAQGSFTANATLMVTAAAPAPATTSPFSGNILISLGVIWLKVATGPASVKLPPGTVAKVCVGTVCTGQVAPASGIVSAVQGQDIELAVMAMGPN